jgi:hypothetical protein
MKTYRGKNLLKIMTKNSIDDYQTPTEALKPLLPFLKRDWTIWECACGKGNLVNELEKNGFQVIGTDIKNGYHYDFINSDLHFQYDCIITNPPFSKKNEFIEKCYALGKPFALILPLTALETQRRQTQWKKGLQLILFNKRINFETPTNKDSRSWFASAWFTYGLNLPKDIIFKDLMWEENAR